MTNTLLVELHTEELPPKALSKLAGAFSASVAKTLKDEGFLTGNSNVRTFATPRRLALTVSDCLGVSPDKNVRMKVLPVSVGLDKDGKPTPPMTKKLTAMGIADIDISTLEIARDGKNDCFFYNTVAKGVPLASVLQTAIEKAASSLPIPKVMTYQRPDGETVEFVRPVHAVVAMHGSSVLPVSLLGLTASDFTYGHRFLSEGKITVTSADDYEKILEEKGRVIADFTVRKEKIRAALLSEAAGRTVLMPEELLDEVCSLVEWPAIYECAFDESFLAVPQECLILTMQTNQKYFALTDDKGQLLPSFLIVSNIETDDPSNIIGGNERVVRPRLADARFFFEQDKKKRLEDRIEGLSAVVYHNKLGTLAQRMERVRTLAVFIAQEMGINTQLVDRAARLAKTDLLTEMVGEFPELQGIMGTYYARHDGEHEEVAAACTEHYMPRFAGDELPSTPTGTALALADKLETLSGIWGIGLLPTGDRDPFSLRRHAIGILRILIEKKLPLSLSAMLGKAADILAPNASYKNASADVTAFMMDRLRGLLRDRGYTNGEVESVLAQNPDTFDNITDRLDAVKAFAALPQAATLAAANKRITNILKKSDVTAGDVHPEFFVVDSEKTLHEDLLKTAPEAKQRFDAGDYTGTLMALATLHDDVYAFFENVMVMDEDPKLRNNRIALLKSLHGLMNCVADISRLEQQG